MERFDVVVVGARCAGATVATLLARLGARVCLLDRARFPSETPSTHVIQPNGVRSLERLGVLDAVCAAGAAPVETFTLVNDDVRIDGALAAVAGGPGLCVRRVTLDALLLAAAADAGAQVRTGCRVTGLLWDDHRAVVGVTTRQESIRARLVIGADGRHSTVAAAASAAEYLVTPGGRMPMWAYFEGVGDRESRFRLARIGSMGYLACPTDGELYLAGIAPALADRTTVLADRDQGFARGIAAWPELADLLAGGRRVGPIRVMAPWHGYFRPAAGPGWALVGDAGQFKDFTPAQGIADAFRQAERLVDAVHTGLNEPGDLATSLQGWWRWRDQDARAMHWFAADLGVPGASTPLITRLLADVAADPRATRDLLRVLDHDLAPDRLLTRRRRALAAAGALRDQPTRIPGTIAEIIRTIRQDRQRSRS